MKLFAQHGYKVVLNTTRHYGVGSMCDLALAHHH